MNTQTDGKGHTFVDVENIRITYIPAADRDPDKDWVGSDVLRIQAYRGPDDRSLFQGAEFPISSSRSLVELISGLCILYLQSRSGAT